MKRMQQSVAAHTFVLLASTLLVAACSSHSSSPTGPSGSGQYYLRFNANGSQVSFTSQPTLLVAFAQSGTQYNALITGYTASANASLTVFNGSAINTGTFSGYNIVGSALVGATIAYQDASGTLYSSGTAATDAVITITDKTSTTFKGTFSGRLKAVGKTDIVVTSGEFFVKRAN
jgi:hypothetical protein